MLEDQVAFLLQKYLGNYVRGLNKEALKISVWRGDVELTNMQLKPEALNSLKLPVRVKAGFLGSVKLKVPWSRLGQEPVLVYLDRIFILAEPATQVEGCNEDAVQEAKRSRVREMEIKLLERQQQLKSELNSSWLGSFISTVIGNIKLSIGNIHIRYEDVESNPGHPFAAGLVLSKLSAVTVDDLGKETFATGGDLDRVKKSVELESLAMYFNSDSSPWTVDKPWEDLLPSEWSQIFEFPEQGGSRSASEKHSYILQPVSGKAKYTKLQLTEAKKTGQALQNAAVDLDDVTLSLSRDGYRDILKMADNFSSFNQRLRYAHLRPSLPVKSDPRAWWKYAYKVVTQEIKKSSGSLSWEQLLRYARLRKEYVSLYASLLKSDMSRLVVDDHEEIKRLDRELDTEVILQWRMLAHKFVEQSAEAYQYAQQNKKQSWWSFGWTGSSKDEEDSKSFTDEDWERLNRIIGYKGNTEYIPDQQDMKLMQFDFEIHMKHNASKLTIDDSECLADLSCQDFCCNLKMYPEAKIFDLKLGSYRLLSPYGVLAESADVVDSFVGIFSYKPFDQQLDWSLTAKASPCYITYLKDSIDQIVGFFKSSPTISQNLALETAAAVQLTLDEVKRTAQQQMTRVLKDQSRFSLNMDIAAPKITVPTKFRPDDVHETKLLLDLGNLVLRTEEIWDSYSSEEQDIYLNFNLVLSDVSAFLVDGDYHWNETSDGINLLPVIDKCGIALKLQQIQLESPLYPSTRMALRVPSLGFHFSPARYHRLMEIVKIFQDSDSENSTSDVEHLWDQADFEGWSSLLAWKGVGNREAAWQRRYLRLVGPFLYVFENSTSTTYKQWFSLRGKQVHQVPAELTNGVHNILALHDSGQVNPKILEDTGALIFLFDTEEGRKIWQSRLQGAIYRASGSAAVSSFPEVALPSETNSFKGNFADVDTEKLFVAGILDELKICFSCGYEVDHKLKKVLLAKESSLFEFRAVGGQVELSVKSGNLLIGTILRSLEIEDQYYYPGSPVPRFLARSFINSMQTQEVPSSSRKNSAGPKVTPLKKSDSEENFYEASDDFDEFETPMLRERTISDYFSTQNFLPASLPSLQPPTFSRIPGLIPDSELQTVGFTLDGNDTIDSFVKAQIVIYDQHSPQYNNLDNRVVVTVATLTFFCHRPTVIAIMEFMNAINLANVPDTNKYKDTYPATVEDDTYCNSMKVDVVCLQETKMSEISHGSILTSLGSDFSYFVDLPSVGASGGILVAWRHDLGPATATRVDNFSVSVQFCPTNGQAWWLTCVYGPQGDDNKVLFLQELREIRLACQGPWLTLGDYNLITSDEEKNNSNLNRAMMALLRVIKNDLEPEPAIKGLLAKGKSRIVFHLTSSMAEAQILLMNENGDRLATLSQNNLSTDIKVFTSSFSIKAALGNLKISDDSLRSSHPYFWVCDMRNPGGRSFVEIDFTSFNVGDEDYCGYDYSLVGQLSQVRIVYLNRFVQEIISYFMGLVPKSSDGVVKLKDDVTNSEKWVSKTDMEGSPALKLDVSFSRPIIVMPRETNSADFLELDVLYITVQNEFRWIGGDKNEMSAVHLDILTVTVKDINLVIGMDMVRGETIIQDVEGLSFELRRSLRDLRHQLPAVEAAIKVDVLKAALSNREYEIISECALSNFSETPRTVPTLNDPQYGTSTTSHASASYESIQDLSHDEETWISNKFSVSVNLVELSLHSGSTRDSPLASVQASGAWLLYKSNTREESFLYATLKGFSVFDDREGTKDELRLAIGKSATVRDTSSVDGYGNHNELDSGEQRIQKDLGLEPIPSMLILDAIFRKSSSSLYLCVQRPKFLVALDFLLAIVEFFVPSARSLLSNDEDKNLLHMISPVILNDQIYYQEGSTFSLSPQKPLIVDSERFDHFIYDGKGGKLYLLDREGKLLSRPSSESFIHVLGCKRLQFRNVTIVNGEYLDSCVSLGDDCCYSASENDCVYFIREDDGLLSASSKEIAEDTVKNASVDISTEFIMELQAIGPELTFYSTSRNAGENLALSTKVIHARTDAHCRLVMKGGSMEMNGNILGLKMESNGIRVIEPFDMAVKYSNASGKTNLHVLVSEIYMNFSFSILRLFLAVEEEISAFLRMSSKKMSLECYQFDKVTTVQGNTNDQVFSFWRPRAPSGYAIFGDYLTPMNDPPTKRVLALNTNVVRVKRPLSYKLVCQFSSPRTNVSHQNERDSKNKLSDVGQLCSVWLPVAPTGYVAMGCVVSPGAAEPPLSSVFCLTASLVSSCNLRDCIALRDNGNMIFWRVDNSFGSFLPGDPSSMSMHGHAYDLRHMLFNSADSSSKTISRSQDCRNDAAQLERSVLTSGRLFEAVASFKLIWSNSGTSSPKKLSIWRPMLSEGMFYFGDIAVNGYEPPNSAVVLRDTGEHTFLRAPEGYDPVGRIKKHRGTEGISFWFPKAPSGFVALGCVASKNSPEKEDFRLLRCIRSDMVMGGQFSEESVWDSSSAKTYEPFSLWTVDNDAGTFLVRSGYRKPPKRLALKLAGPSASRSSDNIVVDAEIKTFSAVSFDDYGGMMVPLFGMSFDDVGLSYHGGSHHVNATVNLSFVARSYSDKYSSWEPFIEPMDGFLRYQYDMNTPGSPGQLRITSTRDLNVNVSVSNTNMLSQAYASWNNISLGDELYKKEIFSSTEQPVLDVHRRRSYYVVPQNKLGQDIYIRTTENSSSLVTLLPSGDDRSIKVPASNNLLDSHLNGKFVKPYRLMVTAILADAEIKVDEGLAAGEYMTAVRLFTENHSISDPQQQSARTCAAAGEHSSQNIRKVNWNEMFFFKVESEDSYILELLVLDAGKGQPVGIYSAPLKQVVQKLPPTSNSDSGKFDLTLGDLMSTKTVEPETVKPSGKIRFAVLVSGRASVQQGKTTSPGRSKTGYIQISPSKEGPWTNMKLNYAVPAACWRFGNCVIASEATVKEGNRYLSIRSLVSVTNTTNFVVDLRLKARFTQSARSDEWGKDSSVKEDQILIGMLEPNSVVPVPLPGLSHAVAPYMLQLRPAAHHEHINYSWSDVQERRSQTEFRKEEILDICVSDLYESENLLFCSQIDGTSSSCHGLWFCLSIEAKEIGKDVNMDPVYDWSIIIKSPLCLAYYLPIPAHYTVSSSNLDDEDSSCSHGALNPGEAMKVHNVDPRNPLYLSLIPHGGWEQMHEPVLISHPTQAPSKFINLRSSLSRRIVQIVLEQSSDNDYLMARVIRIYVPYWISFARLPPLTLRLIDTSGKKEKKRLLARSHLERSEKHLYDIKHDELVEGYTIASGLNFKGLGLLSSVGGHGGQFGAAKELSPLGDMDGTVDLSAYDDDGKCMHILLCSKPSSYQAVPTKVIHVRPYITFTNRFGQDLYIKHSVGDEPKVLQAYDWRVSFMYSEGDTDKLQVRLADTDWCQPLEIVKEDTIVIAMRKQDGTMKFVKAEIRGYEEGSRFLIVFRLGPAYGPIRIENRTSSTTISTRQSGLGEDTWIQVKPLSTRKYSWDDPYGQKAIDVSIQKGDVACVLCVDLENPIGSYTNFREHGLKLSIVETSDIKILKFTDSLRKEEVYGSPGSELIDHQTSALKENEIELDAKPLELIVELGVVGISLIDHKPRELLYLHLQKVFISYMTGYDSGTTSRFKLILGQLQLDNQLPLSTMPVILATESRPDLNRPVFKANIAVGNVTSNGIQVYPHVYIRVINEAWRLNIHEPIIWALVDFYNNLRFVSASSSTTVTEVDPEIRIELVDISEIRLKISLETAPTQRPRGVLGVWSPVLSAVGNAFKIQVHLRKVMHRSRYMRKSSIIPAIMNRIKRDLIHNPLHLIFSVDFLGVTKSTLSSLSKGFAELSTDGQFLQLRSKQVWSRRITGVGDGLVQGTEAFAQGLAFGVSGVLRKPVESARQYGLIGIAPGLGRAFVGFIVQPLSGALDFFSLTVDGIGASFMRCVNILSNKSVPQRIRDPRAIHRDGIVREYDKVEAAGQMALYLAEASRYFACTDLFREPSKYAWSDYYEDHFILPNQRIALVTNKRVILLQCLDLDKMDKKPSKILWDVPWEEVLALELAKAGYQRPSHVIIHLKNFRRSENFVRLIKCNVDEDREPQALSLCSSVRKMWRSHQAAVKVIPLKVPSGQRHVYFASDDDKRESHSLSRSLISSRGTSSDVEQRLMNHTVNFQKMWSSEPEIRSRCKLVAKQVADDGRVFSIWRPLCPNGYISVGDVAHVGTHPPQLAAVYKNVNENFVLPLGYDLVWRNCAEDYKSPVSIWLPRPPDGYVALGCVAVPAFEEPPLDSAFCVDERLAEAAEYEEQIIWASSDAYPWGCYIYQVQSSSLQFMALRVSKEQSEQRPKKIVESLMQRAPATPRQEKQT